MSRRREDAGKSEASWIKHEVLYKVAFGQASAWRATHPNGKMVIVDMTAGDGSGVARPQLGFWGDNPSKPTPITVIEIATKLDAKVILCECDEEKREALKRKFYQTIDDGLPTQIDILDNHSHAVYNVDGFDYALIINDPCGPKEQGYECMQAIASKIGHADFIIVWDEQFITRLEGVAAKDGDDTPQRRGWMTSLERYGRWNEVSQWCRALGRRHGSRTRLVKASPGFHWRIFVISNYLAQPAQRGLFEVVQ